MSNRISIISVLVAVLAVMTSCLSDDRTEVTYYDDAAITSFSLGTLNRTMHKVTSSGKDSTYNTTVYCGSYTFSIDQEKGLIFNVDSLPSGTVTSKSLVTIKAMNSGYIFLKSLTSDSLSVYTSANDSLDFSKPREIHCYSNDGKTIKKYTVDVRVHKEEADKFYWTAYNANDMIAKLEDLRAVTYQSSIVVYGNVNGVAKAYMADIRNGNSWTEYPLPSQSPVSMAVNDKNIFVLAGGSVYYSVVSSDPTYYEVSAGTGLKTLIGASHSEVYALSGDGKLMTSVDGGMTWAEDQTADDLSYLPAQDINGLSCRVKTNSDIEKFVLIGNRGVAADGKCVVWSKVVDNSDASRTESWMYHSSLSSGYRPAPSLEHLSATTYNDGILMIGGKGIGTCTEKAFSKMYFSRDNGMNWWTDSRFTLPSSFSSSETSFALVSDSDNYLWLIAGSTGQVWRGHLAQLVWE